MSRKRNLKTREAVRAGLVAMKPYKAIAAELGVSESNVKYHASQIYRALGVWGTGARLELALSVYKRKKVERKTSDPNTVA